MRRYRKRLKRARPDPKTIAKQQRRADREATLAAATIKAAAALGSALYGVLYVDALGLSGCAHAPPEWIAMRRTTIR
jgi:hypothetical protein